MIQVFKNDILLRDGVQVCILFARSIVVIVSEMSLSVAIDSHAFVATAS